MKASETNTRYTGKVRECTNYSVRSIKNLFKNQEEVKDRQACSEGEKEVQLKLIEELENFTDCVEIEEFKAKVNTKKSSYISTFVFLLISSVLIILANFYLKELLFVSVGFALLSLLGVFGVFGGFAKKDSSMNIIATRKASNEATKKVVFCANVDAPFKRKFSKGFENFLIVFTVIGIILQLVYDGYVLGSIYFNLYDLPESNILNICSYVQCVFIIFPLCSIFTLDTSSSTNGVANNLSGSYACAGAMRYLSEFDLKLDHTDVCVLLTGAKNANSAGAKAYVKSHAEEDKKFDTHYVCVDTLSGIDTFGIKTKSDEGLQFIENSAKNAEVEIKESKAKYLKGDDNALVKTGLPYVTITTLTENKPDFYETELDNIDCLDVKSTEAAIKILLDSAYLLDSKN